MDELADQIEQAAYIAYRMYVRAHWVQPCDLDDRLADARAGACAAVQRYDENKGTFKTWAIKRASGEIIDGVRRMTHGARLFPRYNASLDDMMETGKHSPFLLADPSEPLEELEAVEEALCAAQTVAVLLAGLPERLRYVVESKYLKGQTLVAIGKSLGVTEARVCQMNKQALQLMRAQYDDAA